MQSWSSLASPIRSPTANLSPPPKNTQTQVCHWELSWHNNTSRQPDPPADTHSLSLDLTTRQISSVEVCHSNALMGGPLPLFSWKALCKIRDIYLYVYFIILLLIYCIITIVKSWVFTFLMPLAMFPSKHFYAHFWIFLKKKKTDWKDASRAHTLKKLGCF